MSLKVRIKAGESLSTPLTVKYGTTLGLFVREAALSEQVKGCKTLEEIEAVRW